ncbi:hypothetical protein [Jiangella alkaliphila]|uniref:F5/8 type C domain-containing protein n=1 Tax=Jiangella alkaliphila TaxID=419479 RepID=A0A1H2JZK2_9ACTN|nr:hypothetical protein [Jiangella alkaliphila]SDU61887.1 hypothetical protein SAMN04488563_3259 [Jiangella alkaliphila]
MVGQARHVPQALARGALAMAVAAGLAATSNPPVTATEEPAEAQALAGSVTVPAGTMFTVSDTHFLGFPGLFNGSSTNGEGMRNPRMIAGYNANRDAVGAGSVILRESTDGGGVWDPFDSGDGRLQPMNFYRMSIASGAVYAIDFEDLSVTRGKDADGNPICDIQWCREVFNRRMLAGSEWVDAPDAKVYFAGKTIAWARFHQGPILMSDGQTLLSTMYGRYGAAHSWAWFTGVVKSTDGGQNWSLVSELTLEASQGFSEPSIAPTSDGGLIAVLRRDEALRSRNIPSNVALYTMRSDEQTGANWDAPVRLSSDGGNSPSVELLGNGALVLASGRTDNQLRLSYDGRGLTWDGPYRPWSNYPTTGGETSGEFAGWYRFDADSSGCCLYRPMRHLGSSGTMGVEAISGTQAFVIGDNCGSGWGCPCPWGAGWMCPQRAGGYAHGTQHGLWKSVVTVNNGRPGRLDLPTMFRNDQLTVVETSFSRYGVCGGNINGCRQSYASFAFDGDIRSDTSLVTAGRSVTLRLPRTYQLTGVGLHMHLQGSTDARIQVSTDGVTFTSPARGARDGYLRPFAAPVTAQYIRISDPNPLVDTTRAFLNEVELYGS